jgi:ankyrin repeat protein
MQNNTEVKRQYSASSYDDALIYAASNGDFNIVKCLIDNGVNITYKNDMALLLSAQNGHLEIYKYLVEFGIDRSRIKNVVFKNCIDTSLSLVKDKTTNDVEFCKYLINLL